MMSTSTNLGKLGLYGKSLIKTDGNSVIGAATARLAASRGAKVMVASLNEKSL